MPGAENEVILGDTRFPIKGAITLTNITVPSNPVIFGDSSKKGDTQALSAQIQSSNAGGARIFRANSRTDTDRFWRSTCETRQRNALTLPPRTVNMGKPSGLTTESLSLTFNHKNEQHFVFSNKVYRWSESVKAWLPLEQTLSTVPTDFALFNNKVYIAYGTGYAIKDENGAWSTVATPANFFVVWDAKLWRIAQVAGVWTIYSLIAGGTWSAALGTLSQTVTPTQLIVYRDATGDAVIYVITNSGLYLYDAVNNGFDESEIRYPNHQQRSVATVFNDGKMYLGTANLGLLSVTSGSQFVAQPVGLDLEDGVSSDQQGRIVDIESEYNWMYVLVDASTQNAFTTIDSGLGEPFEPHQWPDVSGSTTLWAFSGTSWHTMWEAATGNQPGTVLGVSSAYNLARVYWGAAGNAYYQDVYAGTFNPRQIHTREYDTTCSHITAWFDMGEETQVKLFKSILFRLDGMSATEAVSVYYGLDLTEEWTLLGTYTTDGQKEVSLNGALGKTGYYIRLRFDMGRDSFNFLVTPNVEFWSIEWMKLLPATFGFTFLVDLSGTYKGKTPLQLLAKLEDYSDHNLGTTLIPFIYTDLLTSEVSTYYAIISRFAAQLHGGADRPQGQAQVSLIIPKLAERVLGG